MADHSATSPAEAGAGPGGASVGAKTAAAKGQKKEQAKEGAEPVKLRRRLIWACIWGYLGVNFLMFLRFFFPRAIFEPNTVFNAGFQSEYGLGVDQRFLMKDRVWMVKEPDRMFAIFARCTHLGCTPEWKLAENKFKCPCHGSGYDSEGVNFEGPAPRPMDRCHIELDPTGQIVVDSSRLYIRDPRAGIDQFNDNGAYTNVSS